MKSLIEFLVGVLGVVIAAIIGIVFLFFALMSILIIKDLFN